VGIVPPFYNNNIALKDFRIKFYSESVFEKWKQNNSNTPLTFEDFSSTQMLDGFILSKDEGEQLATFETKTKEDFFVLIKSNQFPILDNFYNYATHVNRLLRDEYIFRVKEELKIIDTRYKDITSTDSDIVNIILQIDRYIVAAERESNVIDIQRPTIPKKVSPKSSLTLALSIVFGGMADVFFILVRNAITKRKEL